MRILIILLSLLWSHQALADTPLLVNQLFENLRIVLSQDATCGNGKGYRASAQRIDKLYIPGCWTAEPDHPELVRIDWHNGDFSVLPLKDFKAVPAKDITI